MNLKICPVFKTRQVYNFNYFLTLSRYADVLVSTLIISPSPINNGAFTVAPVSSLTGFVPPVAVSPLFPEGASITLSSTCGRNFNGYRFLTVEHYLNILAFFHELRLVTDNFINN